MKKYTLMFSAIMLVLFTGSVFGQMTPCLTMEETQAKYNKDKAAAIVVKDTASQQLQCYHVQLGTYYQQLHKDNQQKAKDAQQIAKDAQQVAKDDQQKAKDAAQALKDAAQVLKDSQLIEKEADLTKRIAECAARELQCTNREKACLEKEAQWVTRETACNTRESQCSNREKACSDKEGALHLKELALNARESDLIKREEACKPVVSNEPEFNPWKDDGKGGLTKTQGGEKWEHNEKGTFIDGIPLEECIKMKGEAALLSDEDYNAFKEEYRKKHTNHSGQADGTNPGGQTHNVNGFENPGFLNK